jgi:hypothetical protein
MASEGLQQLGLEIPIKSWKYKLERVAKGYVRPTIHSDNLYELLEDWKRIHEHLAIIGEKVERLTVE